MAKALLGMKLDAKSVNHSWENLRLEKMLLSIYFDTWYHICCQQQKPMTTENMETVANVAWLTDNLFCSGPSPHQSKSQNWPHHMKRFYTLTPLEHQSNNPYNKCPVFPIGPIKYNRTFPHNWSRVFPYLYYPEKATRRRVKLSLLRANWCK